jgi:hypothetical protein
MLETANGKQSLDKGHDIGDVTSKNVLILVQYLAQNLGHLAIYNVRYMQFVLIDELRSLYNTLLPEFSFSKFSLGSA